MAGYSIEYTLILSFQKEITGNLTLPSSYRLTEQEILFTLVRREPALKYALSLSVRASEVLGSKLEDYLKRTYSQDQLSNLLGGK